MLFDVSLTSSSIFFLNVKSSIMFSLFNVFFIALLLFSQNNDILSSILKKTLSKNPTIIMFWGLSNDALIIKQFFISKPNAINLGINFSKTIIRETITITTTMLMLITITITNSKTRAITIKTSKNVVAITTMLIAKYMSFILLRLIFRNRSDKL